jgi:hypothetical protein
MNGVHDMGACKIWAPSRTKRTSRYFTNRSDGYQATVRSFRGRSPRNPLHCAGRDSGTDDSASTMRDHSLARAIG